MTNHTDSWLTTYMSTNAPATLTTTAAGRSHSIFALTVGDYIWHKGAFRLITALDHSGPLPVIRMGRFVLHCRHAYTVEVPS